MSKLSLGGDHGASPVPKLNLGNLSTDEKPSDEKPFVPILYNSEESKAENRPRKTFVSNAQWADGATK